MSDISTARASEAATPDLSIVWQFFGNIPNHYKELLEPVFEHVCLAPNERLIQQGEVGNSLYIVLKGKLRVIDEELDESTRFLTFKEPGEGVGEIALLTGERRTASVDSVTETELVSLSRQQLETVTQDSPDAGRIIFDAISHRVHQSRLNHVLIKTNVFKDLDETVLQDIQAELELMTVASGNKIMEVGDAGDALFIVIGGRLRVVSEKNDEERPYIVDTHRGQTVGEIGLITGEKRTATVFALRDSLLAKLSRDAFGRLLQKHPEAMLAQFAGPIIERLRDQLTGDQPTTGDVTTITIIPTDKTIPLAGFATKLSEALQQVGSTLHLNSARCDTYLSTTDIAYLNEDDPKNGRFVFWLNEREASHDYVVYEADYEPTAWTRRCIRQADLVLIVGNANASPELCAIETSLLTSTDTQQIIQCLVLLHDHKTQLPKNTAQWLVPRNVRNHYHLCLHKAADFMRIGRLLTGQGVGLVLSGGGARALAHIGVIRALVEKGVPIDAIGGVSGGAIVAGLWAMERNIDVVLEKSQRSVDRIDYTIPIHALTTGKNWTNSMATLFGNVCIEDTWTSFFCISANLSQAKLLIHESDSLMHAVRASTAIPGILPPVFHDGDILVDGGLINNLPTDIMKARPDIGHVIAIDVGTADKTKKVKPFDYAVSGWKSLWKRINPWTANPEFPSIGEVMLRSISITNAQTASLTKRIIDLYLEPPVQAFGLMDFVKIKMLADIGYQYAVEKINVWQHAINEHSEP
jgi:predicted acylesterase/phospholipase RssA/CRP-like cAMP-binding protein